MAFVNSFGLSIAIDNVENKDAFKLLNVELVACWQQILKTIDDL